jgi:hypothetical protein
MRAADCTAHDASRGASTAKAFRRSGGNTPMDADQL